MKPWVRSAGVLGFAAGGLFDGILLHQILQWHHLLSLVPGVERLREQVLWDGYFHAFMYVAAGIGLVGLWRARAQLEAERWQSMAGVPLLGFAAWHTVDSVVSHWWLGIHRIRIDSPDPLMWDLAWLAGFGLVPAIAGALLLRQPPSDPPRVRARRAILPLLIATPVLAAWSLSPPQDQRFATVVFAPWVTGGEAITAIGEAHGRLVWTDPALAVMVVEVPADRRLALYTRGALLVSGGAFAAGCIDWSRPPA
jgi:uncharacterized membrane protein